MSLWSFQGPRGLEHAQSFKTQQRTQLCRDGTARRDRRLFQASRLSRRHCREAVSPSRVPTPAGVIAPTFPRKEVIQPQLPLRLPCYDFTPIIDPTFDGSLPKGLGHRLRVLPTFVV